MYSKVTPQDISCLQKLLGETEVLTGSDISPDYAHDELGGIAHMPEVLVRVRTTEQVSEVMKLAWERNIPVTVRGSGTGLVGSAVAVEGGILMETTAMNKILELDRDNLTVTVQPGVLLMELAAFCEDNDFLYPPDPGEKSATIGGNISRKLFNGPKFMVELPTSRIDFGYEPQNHFGNGKWAFHFFLKCFNFQKHHHFADAQSYSA